ncbi:MAG: bifunctional aminoglycoside phosphotransferase/ATP-binding protein [Betaproteobacteria bacterium]
MITEQMPQDGPARGQSGLVEALRNPACYSHPVGLIRIIETHISYVVLTGTFAYKIKKSVNFGFLDFTTLEKRRFFCEEELRLNARLAPEIYLDVVPISGTQEAPRLGNGADVIEYAVRMREFPQQALADRVLASGDLTSRHIDNLAARVAEFHLRTECSGENDGYGAPEMILAFARQNFSQIRALPLQAAQLRLVDEIEAWSRREHSRLCEVFVQRKREGRVRECHGDLHLGNIVLIEDAPRLFDCIEFNPNLRWIDVMNEVAFLVMDLQGAGRNDFARRFLNAYLEATGDYAGLQVLRYYCVYRAMVRAKVLLMRAGQQGCTPEDRASTTALCRRYLSVAASYAQPSRGFVLITHGFSGSGKTTLSQPLLELSGAIRVRSDIERKRIHGLAPKERAGSGIAEGLYRPDATESTYRRLLDLARIIVEAGNGVIVDATFLQHWQREMFRALATRAGIPFLIVDFTAGEAQLRERIRARSEQGDDASDADLVVLEHQLRTNEPLRGSELESVFAYDASAPADRAERWQTWVPLLQRLSLTTPPECLPATGH